ncbi:MAG: FAD binding domain-containing protein [Rhodospirillaceae bacterium]
MNAFSYFQPKDIDAAVRAGAADDAKFLGGGTNLLDLMKGGIERPLKLIDVTRLPLATVEELPNGGLRIGAGVRNSDAANHPLVRTRYPLLADALLHGASAQLRNMATVGGNLMQRTRCHYFYDTGFSQCNKRAPGSGCAALDGYNRMHAILGASAQCIATNPSDMSVALVALDALVRVRGPDGERTIPATDFHRLPGDTPHRDTNLAHGELITAVDLPPSAFAEHSCYLKLRDRASYAFALVSVAAALDLAGETVRGARIALGGVAHKPWRVPEAEALLVGSRLARDRIEAAAARAVQGAKPYRDNAFKVALAQRAIVRAVNTAAQSV